MEMADYYDGYVGNETSEDSYVYHDYLEGAIYYYPYYPYYPAPNKTEQAYNILKALVGKKIIPTPKSFKKFTELMDAIKEAI